MTEKLTQKKTPNKNNKQNKSRVLKDISRNHQNFDSKIIYPDN